MCRVPEGEDIRQSRQHQSMDERYVVVPKTCDSFLLRPTQTPNKGSGKVLNHLSTGSSPLTSFFFARFEDSGLRGEDWVGERIPSGGTLTSVNRWTLSRKIPTQRQDPKRGTGRIRTENYLTTFEPLIHEKRSKNKNLKRRLF